MADIVLYGSSQDEQAFPPLLTRAMSFGIPVIAPDYPVIKKYVGLFSFCRPRRSLHVLCNLFLIESSP